MRHIPLKHTYRDIFEKESKIVPERHYEQCPATDTDTENNYILNSYNYQENMLSVYNSAAKFVAKLHSVKNLLRSDVNNIRYFVETLILNPVVQFIEQSQNPYNNSNKSLINVLKDVTMLFDGVKTESKLNKVLQEKDLIGNVHSFQINNNEKSNGIVMPLEFQFKKNFEHDDFIDKVLEHMEFIQSNDKFINYRAFVETEEKFIPP
ncbi:hypothetical protein CVS40_11743 [Lucilia cuprina]|nr:hypothetical protein CVS40_11743 [Lucilia cuprina]